MLSYDRVHLDLTDPEFPGAGIGNVNKEELSAAGEALAWLAFQAVPEN